MQAARLDYAAPTTVADAIALLTAQPDALVVDGGYYTVIDLKMRRINPGLLVDLRKIPELYGITVEGDGLRIGVMSTQRALMDDTNVRTYYAALAEAAEASGDPQMRNMETVGDDLSDSTNISDVRAALLAFDAVVHVRGAKGERSIPLASFSTPTSLKPGEIIVAVTLPVPSGVSAYEKFKHPASFRAVCGVAVSLTLGAADNTVQHCAIAVTGATDQTIRLSDTESALQGQTLSAETIAEAVASAGESPEYVSDLDFSGEYRAVQLKVLLKRALTRLA